VIPYTTHVCENIEVCFVVGSYSRTTLIHLDVSVKKQKRMCWLNVKLWSRLSSNVKHVIKTAKRYTYR